MEANLFTDPFGSGFINFLIGILFILGTYHSLLYFQQKDRSYLLYGAYAYTVMLTLLPSLTQGFIYSLHPDRGFLPQVEIYLIEVSYALYFLFAFHFLEMKKNAPRWDNFVKKAIYVFFAFCSLIQIAFFILGQIVRVVKASRQGRAAIACLRRLIALDADNPSAWQNLASAAGVPSSSRKRGSRTWRMRPRSPRRCRRGHPTRSLPATAAPPSRPARP